MTRPAAAEQLYVTHCTRGDSLLGQEGFGVRAASSADPALLRFALEFPAHELPVEMWGQRPTPAQAPRRLARVELADGRVALVHSSYLPHDTRGRDGNFFTHVLVYERLGPEQALGSWASPRWQTGYPSGAPKELPTFAGVPAGGPVCDKALAAFLDPSALPLAGADLATTIFPERARAAGARRRHWMRRALAACLGALAEPEAARAALYVRAEPGLLALLLYGAVRLLPPALTGRLTFSTYERPGEALREFRHARVVGTFTPAQPWADGAHLRHGTALDLWQEPEAAGTEAVVSAGLDHLVACAAAGDWGAVAEVHALWSRGTVPSAATVAEAAAVQPVLRRLHAGPPAVADAAELARSPLGRTFLEDMAATLFPPVWGHCLGDARDREVFADFLRGRRQELEDRLTEAVAGGSGPPWPRQWELLRAVFPPADAGRSWQRVLGRVRGEGGWRRFSGPERLALLRAWAAAEPPALLPEEFAGLLDAGAGEGLAPLVGGLPPGWAGQALCRALADGDRAAEVVALLHARGAGLVGDFCEAVRTLYGARADELLAPLLPRKHPEAPATFALLQAGGLALDEPVLERLLARAGAARGPWLQHWIVGENLVWLGRALPAGSDLLRRVWASYSKHVTAHFLLGDRKQEALVSRLESVRAALGDRTPAEAAELLDDLRQLRTQLHAPPPPSPRLATQLQAVRQRRGLKAPATLLKRFFAPSLSGPEPVGEERLRQAAHSAAGLCGPDPADAFAALLDLVDKCPAAARAGYQRFFLENVNASDRAALVERFRDRLALPGEEVEGLLAGARRGGGRLWLAGLVLGLLVIAGVIMGVLLARSFR